MHRNRTWLLDPIELRTQRNRILPIEGGDGSTLSLDFTTGVLDPRLTFTRGTNATFINSNGLVEWAPANMLRNSVWTSTTLPSGWLANGGNTGTVTYNGNGTITCAATSQIAWIYPDFPYVVTQNGLSYICSFRVVSISGPTLISDILSAGNLTASDYFINGVSVGASPSSPSGNVTGPCVVSVRVNATSTSWYPRFGVGVQGVNRTATITMSEPHAHPGTVPVPYLANTSTSASNHNTPRFDNDPTSIGTPRGLLIEGQAVNLVWFSNGLSQNPWFDACNVVRTTSTGGTAPDGTNNTASRISMSAAITNCSSLYYNGVTVTNQQYTHSVFAKADGADWIYLWVETSGSVANGAYFNLTGNGSVGNLVGSGTTARIEKFPNGWYRCQTTSTQPAGTTYPCMLPSTGNLTGRSSMVGTTPGNILVWGDQFEAGSGASSYIPTGASQGSRAYDHCYATGANFTSWFSVGAGTMVAVSDNIKNNSQNIAAMISDDSLNNYVRMGFKVGGATNEYLLTTVGPPPPFQGAVDSGYAPPLNTVYRMAYAWDTNNFGIVANGGAVVTDSSGTLAGAGVLTRLVVGGDFVAVPNDIYFKNGHIRSLKYWPYRLPNAQLQSLTT